MTSEFEGRRKGAHVRSVSRDLVADIDRAARTSGSSVGSLHGCRELTADSIDRLTGVSRFYSNSSYYNSRRSERVSESVNCNM